MITLRSYSCSVIGHPHSTNIIAHSAGKARYAFMIDVRESLPDIRFQDISVHSNRRIIEPAGFRRNAEYRQIPFAMIGMKVIVSGESGRIVGHNSSANLDVLFEDGKWAGQTLNCHPHSEIAYYDDRGELIVAYDIRCQKQVVT